MPQAEVDHEMQDHMRALMALPGFTERMRYEREMVQQTNADWQSAERERVLQQLLSRDRHIVAQARSYFKMRHPGRGISEERMAELLSSSAFRLWEKLARDDRKRAELTAGYQKQLQTSSESMRFAEGAAKRALRERQAAATLAFNERTASLSQNALADFERQYGVGLSIEQVRMLAGSWDSRPVMPRWRASNFGGGSDEGQEPEPIDEEAIVQRVLAEVDQHIEQQLYRGRLR
jgi:hypothetical protein